MQHCEWSVKRKLWCSKSNYNTEALKSNLCDNNDAYILVISDFTAVAVHATELAFKTLCKIR